MRHQASPTLVTIQKVIDWKDLEERVRRTPLLNDRDVYPYANATIALAEIPYEKVRSTSLYVARTNLRTQTQIARDIALAGYHPLELRCGLELASTDENGQPIVVTLVPPIVEQTDDEGMYVLDGSHRTNQGRWQGRTSFLAILISGIDPAYPAYAHPNGWDEVVMYDEPPRDPALRKRYRQGEPNHYRLYRDFRSLNGSKPRYDQ